MIWSEKLDIIDEALTFFRANVFFRKFDVKSPADKLLVYLTFYINMVLKRIESCRTEAEGTKSIINLGIEGFPIPGEAGFPISNLFAAPQSEEEGGMYKLHLSLIPLSLSLSLIKFFIF